MFEVLRPTGADAEKWRAYVDMLPYDLRDVHLSPEWALVNERAAGHGAMGFLAVSVDDARGFIVCKPFLGRPLPGTGGLMDITSMGYGGPFTSSTLQAIPDVAQFERSFDDWCRVSGVVSEFAMINPVMAGHQHILLRQPQHLERGVVILPVTGDPGDIYKQVRPNRRQSLKKGAAAAVHVIGSPEFYALYENAMERKQASKRWRFAWDYFMDLLDVMKGKAVFLGAHHDGVLQAAAVFLVGAPVSYYQLAATGEEPMDGYADMVIMAGAGLARQHGASWLHLGGGLSVDDSLMAYKMSWGGMVRPVYSVRRIFDEVTYKRLSDAVTLPQSNFFPAYRRGA